MKTAFPDRFVAELCPYQRLGDRESWSTNPGVVDFLTKEAATGRYSGIGELHILRRSKVDWDVIEQVLALAKKHGLFVHMHAGADAIQRLFSIEPDIRILWAHAGFYEKAETISAMLDKYPKLTAELSLRAPNIFPALAKDVGNDWLTLFESHPDRIVLGSDTYVNLAWAEYDEIINEHRRWLSRLPRPIAEKIAWRNAQTFFALPERLFQSR